jgi:hypothetical protein
LVALEHPKDELGEMLDMAIRVADTVAADEARTRPGIRNASRH